MVSFSLHPCGSNPAGTKTPVLMCFFHRMVPTIMFAVRICTTNIIKPAWFLQDRPRCCFPLFSWYFCGSSCKRGVWTGPSVQRYLSLSLSLQTGTMCLKNIDSWDRSEPADAGFPKIHRIMAKKMMTNKKMKVDSADSDCNCWPFWWCVPWCSPLSEKCPSRQNTKGPGHPEAPTKSRRSTGTINLWRC